MNRKQIYLAYYNRIGDRFSVFNGKLIADSKGDFTVSTSIQPNSIYINNYDQIGTIIPAQDNLIGRSLSLKRFDCFTLTLKKYDEVYSTDFSSVVNQMTFQEYAGQYKLWNNGQLNEVANRFGANFIEDSSLIDNTIFSYRHTEKNTYHFGYKLEGNFILTHFPDALSSVYGLTSDFEIRGRFADAN
jgi:hypothetical protein